MLSLRSSEMLDWVRERAQVAGLSVVGLPLVEVGVEGLSLRK